MAGALKVTLQAPSTIDVVVPSTLLAESKTLTLVNSASGGYRDEPEKVTVPEAVIDWLIFPLSSSREKVVTKSVITST